MNSKHLRRSAHTHRERQPGRQTDGQTEGGPEPEASGRGGWPRTIIEAITVGPRYHHNDGMCAPSAGGAVQSRP